MTNVISAEKKHCNLIHADFAGRVVKENGILWMWGIMQCSPDYYKANPNFYIIHTHNAILQAKYK